MAYKKISISIDERTYAEAKEAVEAGDFRSYSQLFEDGAKKYGENNWQKGIPEWCYIDSAIRHYLKWERGDKDERHDRAVLWNLACLMWTIKHKDGE